MIIALAMVTAGNNMGPDTLLKLAGAVCTVVVIVVAAKVSLAAVAVVAAVGGSGAVAVVGGGLFALGAGLGAGGLYRRRCGRRALADSERRACEEQMYGLSSEVYELLSEARSSGRELHDEGRAVMRRYMELDSNPKTGKVVDSRQRRLEIERLRQRLTDKPRTEHDAEQSINDPGGS